MSKNTKANVICYYADAVNEMVRKNCDSNIAVRIIDYVNRIYDLAKQLEVNENDKNSKS